MKNYLKVLLLFWAICSLECAAQTVSGKKNGHDYVDLGLPSKTKWATCNVGANKPTKPGNYFAWGEVKPKKDYSENTYKWKSVDRAYASKYVETRYSDMFADDKFILEKEDDAAAANWGNEWRMPTSAEQKELLDGCNWESTNNFKGSGVAGFVGTSKTNGNTIFLPAVGFRRDDSILIVDQVLLWSASLMVNYGDSQFCFVIRTGLDNNIIHDDFGRYDGLNVRAVVEERKEYTVEFYDADSVLIETQKVTETLSATKIKAPIKEGYRFVGWSDSSFVNVKGNLKVYAQFKKYEFVSGTMGKYDYVDLGFPSGTKWATYNVGATKISEFGNYYAWGETKPKNVFNVDTYRWTEDEGDTFTKYYMSRNTNADNLEELEDQDDAASVNWGYAWRMPTMTQLAELERSCTWEWTDNFFGTGVAGMIGTSTFNGMSIFLPAAGYRNDTELINTGTYGSIWSSSLYYDDSYYAFHFYYFKGYCDFSYFDRHRGSSVRAVLK